jgi:hypothetical protein
MISCLPGSTSVNTFGEQFGDEYPTGVWGKFKKEVSSNISEIVVAVASFHGDFIVMRYLLFNIYAHLSLANGSYGVQVKKSSLHAQDFSLTMMDVRLF